MFGPFERTVAARYLRARKGERFVSVIAIFSLIGIALGVATLIIVMSVMNGFRQELLGRILGLNGELSVHGAPLLTNYDALVTRLHPVPGVLSAIPLVESAAGLKADQGSFTGGIVRGIRQADLRQVHVVADNIRAGSLDKFQGDDAVAIGTGLAAKFGLGIGSQLQVYAPDSQSTAFGSIPRGRGYTVVAIFQVGFNEADTGFVFMPLDAAQTLFQVDNAVTQIDIATADPDNVSAVNRAVRGALGDVRGRVIDWTQMNNSLFAAVEVERNVMFLILTLIILVAAFNIVSSLIMMVKDKTGDIAVLRTIGAGSGAIMRIFLMCGAFVGIAGTAVGTVLGVVFCLNIERIRHALESLTGTNLFNPEVYFLSRLPAVLQWQEVTQVIVMALFLSLLATLYPSWKAARTDPVEALRHE